MVKTHGMRENHSHASTIYANVHNKLTAYGKYDNGVIHPSYYRPSTTVFFVEFFSFEPVSCWQLYMNRRPVHSVYFVRFAFQSSLLCSIQFFFTHSIICSLSFSLTHITKSVYEISTVFFSRSMNVHKNERHFIFVVSIIQYVCRDGLVNRLVQSHTCHYGNYYYCHNHKIAIHTFRPCEV